MNDLEIRIRHLRRRVRLLLMERSAMIGGGIGAVLASVMALLSSRVTELLSYPLWAGTVAAGLVIGALFGWMRKPTDLTIAVVADKRTGLKERVSTALAMNGAFGDQEMEASLIADADEHIARYKPSEVFPHRFRWPHAAFAAALLMLFGIVFFPQIALLQSHLRRQEVSVMKREGNKMVKVAKDLKKQAGPKQEELRKLAGRLDRLGKAMETARMSRKMAMLKTQKLTKEIEEAQDRLARANSGMKPMERAQAEMRKSSQDMARQMAQRMAKAGGISPEAAMKKIPTDKRMAELARKSGPLTSAEQAELEKAVSKYADPRNAMPIPSELGEALAKLAANKDYQKAAELMQQLAKKLALGKGTEQDKEMLKKQLEQLAKALKDTDLDKLAKQMRENAEKLAKMSPEELEKLLKDIQQAERVAQSLKDAGGT